MHDDEVALGDDDVVLVPGTLRQGAAEIEEPVAARRDVGAVLDAVGRPEARSSLVVALVEERAEGLEDERLVPVFEPLAMSVCSWLRSNAPV